MFVVDEFSDLEAWVAKAHPEFPHRFDMAEALAKDRAAPAYGTDWADFMIAAVPRCFEATIDKLREDGMCECCLEARWGTQVPIPGVVVVPETDAIECCDECEIYPTDFEAAQALAGACRLRGLSDRIRHTIDGYST